MKVDVKETENEVIATCDLPVLEKKEDIDLKVEPGALHISGTINRSTEEKQENVHRRERYVGRFHRTVPLPSPVSNNDVKASYKNGVLEVTMPKEQKDDQQKIDVEFH